MFIHESAGPKRLASRRHISEVHRAAQRARFERPEPFEIEIRPARQQVVVAPLGELDMATTDRLADAVDDLLDAGFDDIVLDFRGLSFMDSTGLQLVIEQARRPDATVRIVDGADPVARLFDLTGTRAELPFLAPHEVPSAAR